MSKTNSAANLAPELASLLHAIRVARPCEQASYVSLDARVRASIDTLVSMGLVKIENAIPRPVAS